MKLSKTEKYNATVLHDWCLVVTNDANPYLAPERVHRSLKGRALHPVMKVEQYIRTSPVVDAEGRYVKTFSGSIYKLGRIDPKYRKWLKANYTTWDPKNPIKILLP